MERPRGIRRKLAARILRRRDPFPPPPLPEDYCDPQRMMSSRSVEQLCETAEEYFRRVEHIDDFLAKPFSRIADTPQLLINFSVLLQGLELAPGMRVLDFAAGTCWATRIFTQLRCEAIALDASARALEIGRELFQRIPVSGEHVEPKFVLFDGRRIDLPDESVDRLFCFDAFHHVPNQEEILREIFRVLVDGGIAAFAEPGPHHSRSAQSQFEMKTFHVLESDIDIDAIWRMAKGAGFADMRLALFQASPFHVSLDEFHDFIAGSEVSLRYLEDLRANNNNVRDFFLYKGERGRTDSRRTEGLGAEMEIRLDRSEVNAGERITGKAILVNGGRATWLPSDVVTGGVSLGSHLYRRNGELISFDFAWTALPQGRRIASGERVEIAIDIEAPAAGSYILEFDMVSNRVCWFTQVNASQPVRFNIDVRG